MSGFYSEYIDLHCTFRLGTAVWPSSSDQSVRSARAVVPCPTSWQVSPTAVYSCVTPAAAHPQRVQQHDLSPSSTSEPHLLLITDHQLPDHCRAGAGEATGIDAEPPLSLFVMGLNEWRHEHEWPLARTLWTRAFLHPTSGSTAANELRWEPYNGSSSAGFTYDPLDPCPSLGAQFQSMTVAGPRDRAGLARSRADILVFESEALAEPVEIVGPVSAVRHGLARESL